MGDELLHVYFWDRIWTWMKERKDQIIALDHCLGEYHPQPRGVGRLKSSLYMRHTLNGTLERMLFVNRYRNHGLGYLRGLCI